jgi:hypothetical protein
LLCPRSAFAWLEFCSCFYLEQFFLLDKSSQHDNFF